MKIVGVSTVKDEPDIGRVLSHMHDQGVDNVIISSDDQADYNQFGTVLPWHWVPCHQPFDQGLEITWLAKIARADYAADWIVPFDADEYWCGMGGLTIREALIPIPDDINTIYCPMFLHLTPELREPYAKPLNKVAFRPRADMIVAWGNHDVSGRTNYGGGQLLVRELQYTSYDHFLAKVEKARQLHVQPHMASHEYGSHMWRLCQMTPAELEAEWAAHLATPTTFDPIPGSDKW